MTLSITSWQLSARGPDADLSSSPTSLETVASAKVSMPTTSGAASAILAHQNRSSTNKRPLCMQPLITTFQHCLVKQVSHSLTVAHVWVGDRAHGTGKLGTDAGDTAEVLTDGFSA